MVDLTAYENGEIFSPLQHELLKVLEQKGPLTRSELVKKVQSPRTTVYDNLTRLQDKELVRKFSRPQNARGRPLVYFRVNDHS